MEWDKDPKNPPPFSGGMEGNRGLALMVFAFLPEWEHIIIRKNESDF